MESLTVCSNAHCYKIAAKEGNPFPIPLCPDCIVKAKLANNIPVE